MLNILLLIVWIYLSMAFTLFFITLHIRDNEEKKMKLEMKERDEKLKKILELCSNIDSQLRLKMRKEFIK